MDFLGNKYVAIFAGNLAGGLVQFVAWRFTCVGRLGGFGLYLIVLSCMFAIFGMDLGQEGTAVTVLIGLAILLFSLRVPYEQTHAGTEKARK